MGPAGLEGLGRGARSLVLNATYGVCNSVGRIAGTLGDGVSSLTGSRAFQDGRIAGRAGIAFGLREGVSGVVSDVMMGAEEGGIFGALMGSGKGIAGLVLKPMAGALDEAAKQLEGMKEATQLRPKRLRVRLPRVSVGGEIAPFSGFLAEGRELLRVAIAAGNVPAGEEYVVHVPEATGHVIVVSRGKWRLMTHDGDVVWEEKTAGILAATHELHVLFLRFHDSTVSIVCSSVETAHVLCLLLAAQRVPRDDWVAACVRFIAGEYGIPREEEDVRLLSRLEMEFQHPPMRLETPVDALPRDIREEKVIAASIMPSVVDVSSDSTVTIEVRGEGASWKVVRGTGEFRWEWRKEVIRRYLQQVLENEVGKKALEGMRLPEAPNDWFPAISKKVLKARIEVLNVYLGEVVKREELEGEAIVAIFLKSSPVTIKQGVE